MRSEESNLIFMLFGNNQYLVFSEGEIKACACSVAALLAGAFFLFEGRIELCAFAYLQSAVNIYRLVFGVDEHISVLALNASAETSNASVGSV